MAAVGQRKMSLFSGDVSWQTEDLTDDSDYPISQYFLFFPWKLSLRNTFITQNSMYTYIDMYACMYIYICVHIYVYVCIYVCVYVYTHTHTHTHTHT